MSGNAATKKGIAILQRPLWTGQIRVSLVAFGVKLFPATEAKSEIHFHQLSRKTGERIRHQNVSGDDSPVETDDIIKGYEYRKGQYVSLEPDEIKKLRIPSRQTLDVVQFVDVDDIDQDYFEKPYFVLPENDAQTPAFAVIRKALLQSRKAALGKIAFGGREHLVAVMATDDKQAGMMAYTMRFADELRDPAKYFGDIKKVHVDEDQLALALELIKKKAAKFAADTFTDDYETALRGLVQAKIKHAPLPLGEPVRSKAKVINLMDALRESVHGNRPARHGRTSTVPASTGGLSLVKSGKSAKRRSA